MALETPYRRTFQNNKPLFSSTQAIDKQQKSSRFSYRLLKLDSWGEKSSPLAQYET